MESYLEFQMKKEKHVKIFDVFSLFFSLCQIHLVLITLPPNDRMENTRASTHITHTSLQGTNKFLSPMKRKEMKYFTKIEAINATTHFSFASSENVSFRFGGTQRSKAVQLII